MEITSNVKRVAGAGSIMLAALAVGVPTASTAAAASPGSIVATVCATPAPLVATTSLMDALNYSNETKVC